MDKRKTYMNLIGNAIEKTLKKECVIVFFGSILDDRFNRSSDIDVAIFCKDKLSAKEIVELKENFEKIPTLRDIDLVDIRNIKSIDFLENVLEGIIWKNSLELLKDLKKHVESLKK